MKKLIRRLQNFAANTARDEDAQLVFNAANAIETLEIIIDGLNTIIKELEDNVQPVRHGRWIWEEVPTSELGKIVCFKCTVCLKRQTFRSHFCPNCGADMRPQGEAE